MIGEEEKENTDKNMSWEKLGEVEKSLRAKVVGKNEKRQEITNILKEYLNK